MTDDQFWKNLDGSYRRLGYVAAAMAVISVVSYFI